MAAALLSNALWELIEPLLPLPPSRPSGGRPRVSDRACLTGILFVLRSADARWIAYDSDESGRSEIYIQSFPDRDVRVRVTVDGGFEPRWSSDGRTLYFISPDSRLMSVPVTLSKKPETGTVSALFPIPSNLGLDGTNRYRVSRDGQRFLIFSDTGLETSPMTVTVNWAAALK